MRLARAYSLGVALSFAALVALLPASDRAAANHWIVEALRSASWIVAGLSALSVTRDLEQRDKADGFGSLLALRGAGRTERAWSRAIASAARIALGVGVPAFAVLLVCALKAQGAALGAWLTLWSVLIVVYAAALGATLSLLAHGSVLVLAPHARLLFLLAVLVPELLRVLAGWPVPSLPSAFGAFLDLSQSLGRSAS